MGTRAGTPRRSRCSSAPWRFGSACSGPITRTWHASSTISRSSKWIKADTPKRSRCTSERWRFRERTLGPDHPDVAFSLNNLANVFLRQGRYAKAESLCQRSLAIRERALGPDHPQVAFSLNNLANVYLKQGRHAEADPLFERALAIKERMIGPNHPYLVRDSRGLRFAPRGSRPQCREQSPYLSAP